MPPVTLTMTGEDKRVMTMFARQEAKIEDLKRKLTGVSKASKGVEDQHGRTAKKGEQAFSTSGPARYVKMLMGAGGVLAAQRLITAELRHQAELQGKMAEEQITLSGARSSLIRNLQGIDQATILATLKQTREISRGTNVAEQYITSAMASAVSASGQNIPASLAAVEQAGKYLRDRPTEIADFAGSLLDIAVATKTIDARVNQGYIAAIGSMSRITSPRQQALTVPPAVVGQMGWGSTGTGAGALFAAITTGAKDPLGRKSKTASIAVAEQLYAMAFGMGAFAPPEAGKPDPLSGLRPPRTTTHERVLALQQDKEMFKAFFERATFEREMKAPIRQLLGDVTSETAQAYAANRLKIPANEQLGRIADQVIANLGIDPLDPTARTSRLLKTRGSELLTARPELGARGVVRKELHKVLDTTGRGWTRGQFGDWEFDLRTGLGGQSAREAASAMLRQRADTMLGMRFGRQQNIEVSEQTRETADALREIASKLDAIEQHSRQTADNTASQRGPAALAGPTER
jgi:hypothetical protein